MADMFESILVSLNHDCALYLAHFITFVCLWNSSLFDAVMPDFAQVYSFLGSVFDPNSTGHIQRLKQMDPINFETVCYYDFLIPLSICCGHSNHVYGTAYSA